MGHFTDFRVQLNNPQIDIFRGTATASELALVSRTGGPMLLSATELRIQTSLQDIYRRNLSNSDVSVKNALVYVSEKESRDDPEPLLWLAFLPWLPQHFEITQFHLIIESQETWVFQVNDVSGVRNRDISYRILANADYNHQALEIQLNWLYVQEREKRISLKLAGKLTAPTSGGWLKLNGQLRADDKVFTYELDVDGYTENISQLLNLAQTRFKLEGAMELSGNMRGDTRGFSLSNATMMLNNSPIYSFEAQGNYQQSFAGENQLNLFMLGNMDSMGRLVRWTGTDLSSLGSATSNIKLSGSLEQPFIDQFLINTAGESGLSVSLSGSMAPGEGNHGGTAGEERVRVTAHAPTLGVLSPWLGPPPYEHGSFNLMWPAFCKFKCCKSCRCILPA